MPDDNPFVDQGGVAAQVWSLGHRNILGMAFDGAGRLWNHEMGPKGGDEVNLVKRGANYGYPIVSDGDHYDGRDIPDHATRPEFEGPLVSGAGDFTGVLVGIRAGHSGRQGDAFIGGLSSQALGRVEIDGTRARGRALRHGRRESASRAGPDGALWLPRMG